MRRVGIALALAVLVAVVAPVLAATKPKTKRLSVSSNGTEANGRTDDASISANGRFVAFEGYADNLVPNDGNMVADIFVYDRETKRVKRVSVSSSGEEADGFSIDPVISVTGRYVAFHSTAANLVANDANDDADVFVHDRRTGRTTRASVGTDGGEGEDGADDAAISADGRFVAFASYSSFSKTDPDSTPDIFVRDRKRKKTRLVSLNSAEERGESLQAYEPYISGDGRFVSFESDAPNLVPGDGNAATDVFVRDRRRGRTRRASVTSQEQEIDSAIYSSMSANGRYVAFESNDPDVVPGDTLGEGDVFVRDLEMGRTRRASLGRNGQEPNESSGYAKISPDGRFVTFCSDATNIDADFPDGDVFVRDMRKRRTKLISVGARDTGGPNGNCYSSISRGGRFVTWISGAEGLVPNDANDLDDAFVRGPYRSR